MTFLIFLFALAGAVWMVPLVRRGRLSVIAPIVLGVGTVMGPAFFAVDGPIQISLDRVLWAGMFGLAIWQWRTGKLNLPSINRLDVPVAGMVGWFLVSAAVGGGGTASIARWIFYILMPAGMYAIARVIDFRRQDIRWMMMAAIGLSVYLAITAVFEVTGMHSLVFPRFISDPGQWEFLGRGRGPLLNPAGNGVVISVGLMATIAACLRTPQHRTKILLTVIAAVILMGMGATLTRSVWMTAAAIIGLVVVLRAPRWVRVWGLSFVLLLGGLSASGFKDQLLGFKRDKDLTAADAKKSVELRPLLAIVAWEMFKDRPLVGHGYGAYAIHNPPYHQSRSYGMPLEQARSYVQHNVFLSVLVDTGLIGFSMFAAWLAMLVAIGWRLAQQSRPGAGDQGALAQAGLMMLGMLIAYGCNGMFHDLTVIPMVHMFLFFIAGTVVRLYHHGLAASADARHQRQTAVRAGDRLPQQFPGQGSIA